MITVKDLIEANVFRNSEVVAGNQGLANKVTTITVAEVPDAANWLRGGEVVCTTAFFISNQVTYQKEWIESLIFNGASALAIKASRFLGVIPPEIVEVGNQHKFPIISLPHEVTWPSVIESFMDFFMNERIKIMQLVEEVQSNLINLILENKGTEVICNEIARLVENPIILEDASLHTIAIGNAHLERSDFFKDIIKTRLSETFRKKFLRTKFYKHIREGKVEEKYERNISIKGLPDVRSITVPINTNKCTYGFITLLEYNRPLKSVDLIILKHSKNALALQLMQQYLKEQTTRKKNLALIEDIIHGRIHTQIVYEYRTLNIDLSNPRVSIIFEFTVNSENGNLWDRSEERIVQIIEWNLRKHFNQVIVGNDGSTFTTLVSFSPKKHSKMPSLLKRALEEVIEKLEVDFGKNTFFVGVGGIYPDLNLVQKSYKEANNALTIVKKFPQKGPILYFEEIGIYRIFSMINDINQLSEFCDDLLSDLKKYDLENGNELLETLHIYLLSDCSIKEAAEKLYLHPNTVAYRIKKIKQIIKNDLDSPEFKIAYLFALESYALLNH